MTTAVRSAKDGPRRGRGSGPLLILIGGLASFGLHVALVTGLGMQVRNVAREGEGSSEAIKLRVVTKAVKQVVKQVAPKVTERVGVKEGVRREKATAVAKGAQGRQGAASTPTTTAGASAGERAYEGLLPGRGWHVGRMEGEGGREEGRSTGIPPATRANIDELSGRLDIPLFARAEGGDGDMRAVAKLRRRGEDDLFLESLDGDPILRACLYAMLLEPKSREILERLMVTAAVEELLLTFTHTESIAANWQRAVDDFTWADGRLTIRRTTFQLMPQAGMALSDKHAELAKRRDRAALQRLRDLPAFHAPLRRRPLQRAP